MVCWLELPWKRETKWTKENIGEWRSGGLKVQCLISKWESNNPHAFHSRHALAISELNDLEEKNKRNGFSQTACMERSCLLNGVI